MNVCISQSRMIAVGMEIKEWYKSWHKDAVTDLGLGMGETEAGKAKVQTVVNDGSVVFQARLLQKSRAWNCTLSTYHHSGWVDNWNLDARSKGSEAEMDEKFNPEQNKPLNQKACYKSRSEEGKLSLCLEVCFKWIIRFLVHWKTQPTLESSQ